MNRTEQCHHVHFPSPPDIRPQVGLLAAGSAAAGLARLKRLSTGRSESIEIEMTEIEHEPDSCHSPSAGVLRTSEYAGSKEGVTAMPPRTITKSTAAVLSRPSGWIRHSWLNKLQRCTAMSTGIQRLDCDLAVPLARRADSG